MKYLLLLLIFSTQILYGQTKCDCFDRLNNLSIHYDLNKEWAKAIETLEDALAYRDSTSSGYYYYELGEYFNNLHQRDSSKVYFTKAIKFGYPAAYIKDAFPDVYATLDANQIESYRISLVQKIDFKLYDQYVQIFYIDQALRNGTLFEMDDLFDSPPEKKAFIDSMFQNVDNIEYDFINNLLDRFGDPSAYQLGFFPSGFTAFLLHLTAADKSPQ